METADYCSVVLPHSDLTENVTLESVSKVPSTPVHDQETPETLLSHKENSKLKQGRLLFPCQTPPTNTVSNENGETPGVIATPNPDTEMNISTFSTSSTESAKSSGEENMEVASPVHGQETNNSEQNSGEKAHKTTSMVSTAKTAKPKLTKAEREALKLQREKERAKARAKKEAERQRKEKEKQQRELERKEKQCRKELEMKERQEKREREEQERKERKEKKEEERRKKEEERKKSEMEKEQAKEVKLRKKQQQKQHFFKYFPKLPPKETAHKKDHDPSDNSIITPFSIKTDMSLAALPRESLKDKTEFDSVFQSQTTDIFSHGFIENCKQKSRRASLPVLHKPDKPTSVADNDVIVVSTSSSPQQQRTQVKRKFKLLQFHRNYRPAYYGTWSKTSKIVTPRNPFRRDAGLLDYEVDSDDEWEEEEPGESLSDSEGEEADPDEDSGDDDGFFVPHGYLSDEEGDQSDCEGGIGFLDMDDAHKKQKQLAKAKAWEAEFARKCQQLKPIKIGCVWNSGVKGEVQTKEKEFLQKFAAVSLVELPISVETKGETTAEKGCDSTKRPVPDEAMPDLIRLVHGASMGLNRLIDTFRAHWGAKKYHEQLNPSSSTTNTLDQSPPTHLISTPKTPTNNIYAQVSGISKRQLEKKIQAIATKVSRPPTHKYLWNVHDDVFKQYSLDPSTLVPLLQLVSPSPRSVQRTATASSPETPNIRAGGVKSAKKGFKRKLDGMKSFKSLGQSPVNSKLDSFEVPQDTKRPKLYTTSVPVENKEDTLKPVDTSEYVIVLQLKPATTNGRIHGDTPAPKRCRLDSNNVADVAAMDTQPPSIKPSLTCSPTSKENAPLDIKALLPTPVLPQFFIDQQQQLLISPAAQKESTNASTNVNADPML